jgi:hypothetical protein
VKSFTIFLALWGWAMFGRTTFGSAQEVRASKQQTQRTYSQSVSAVKAALRDLAGGTSGRLPALEGFVVPGRHALDQYGRPYYQCVVRVMSAPSGGTPSGGSVVQVTAKITAWYRGREKSGYEGLESNGRIEADLLDRLQESLRASLPGTVNSASGQSSVSQPSVKTGARSDSGIAVAKSDRAPNVFAPTIPAPTPQLPRKSALSPSMPASAPVSTNTALEQEAKNLEEILRNQSHPTNLIAVKRDQTPVSESPSAGSKVLFLASAEDEFEVLDVNPEWVHVRISGLSRGWLRRTSIEMPGESMVPAGAGASLSPSPSPSPSDPEASTPNLVAKSSPLFAVSSDEVGTFPGDWAPLKGKSVKIISVQQASNSGLITSPQDKMRFADGLFKEEVVPPTAEGLVVIFDAEDGGMIAATGAVLQQWRSGSISEKAFWKQCFLDPPELVGPN